VKYTPLLQQTGIPGLPFTLPLAKTSPIAVFYIEEYDLPHEEQDDIVKAIGKGKFRYQHLVDNIDLIFRVPINFKNLTNSTQQQQQLPKKAPSILQTENLPVFNSAKPTVAGMGGGGNYNNSNYNRNDLMSTDSDTSSSYMEFRAHKPSPYGRGQRNNNNKTVIDSDDDSDDEVEDAGKRIGGGGGGDVRDSDDDEAHRPTQSLAMRRTSLRTSALNLRGVGGAGASGNNATMKSLLNETTAWQIPITAPKVTASQMQNEPFPSTEIDSLHVQYLAAARGDWDESVGLRRLSEGINEEIIAAYLDNKFTPIHLAAFLGNYKIIIEFVELGGLNPNIADGNGDTPLHCACKRGHFSIAKYLIEKCQSSLHAKNLNGIIPIQYALKGGYLSIVQYMMEESVFQRILPNFLDEMFGATLLHWACLSKQTDLVDYLLVKQHLPIEQLAKGDKTTCLHWACYSSSVEVVKYLIENALANVQMKSGNGWSCLHFATASGNVDKAVYFMDIVQLKLTDKDSFHQTPTDVARGGCAILLQERKAKGFVTGSIAEKNRRVSKSEKK
jgi:hypothetical protein